MSEALLQIKYIIKIKYFDIRTESPTFGIYFKGRKYSHSVEVWIIFICMYAMNI